jgi:hypothetical protein
MKVYVAKVNGMRKYKKPINDVKNVLKKTVKKCNGYNTIFI